MKIWYLTLWEDLASKKFGELPERIEMYYALVSETATKRLKSIMKEWCGEGTEFEEKVGRHVFEFQNITQNDVVFLILRSKDRKRTAAANLVNVLEA